jgi:hypothetical protein
VPQPAAALAPVLAGIPVLRLERFNKSGNAAGAMRRKSFGPGENISFSKTAVFERANYGSQKPFLKQYSL